MEKSLGTFTVEELQFRAEEELIDILPLFEQRTPLQLISGTFGPFYPGIPARVPLWVAIRYKEDQLCSVVPPHWMRLDYLQDKVAEEMAPDNRNKLSSLPYRYLEVSRRLLQSRANEDISDAAAVEEALHTLTEARKRKLNAAMATTMRFAASSDMPEVIDMKDAGSMEVNLMRTFFESMDHILEMSEESLKATRGAGGRGGGYRGGNASAYDDEEGGGRYDSIAGSRASLSAVAGSSHTGGAASGSSGLLDVSTLSAGTAGGGGVGASALDSSYAAYPPLASAAEYEGGGAASSYGGGSSSGVVAGVAPRVGGALLGRGRRRGMLGDPSALVPGSAGGSSEAGGEALAEGGAYLPSPSPAAPPEASTAEEGGEAGAETGEGEGAVRTLSFPTTEQEATAPE